MTKWTIPAAAFTLTVAGALAAQVPTSPPGTLQPATPGGLPPGAVAQPGALQQVGVQPLTDNDFVTIAGSGGLFEVASSQLALQQSNSDEVKRFAQKMIDDHTKLNAQLAAALGRRGAAPPAALMPVHTAVFQRLRQADKAAFDREYVVAQIAAHGEAAAVFEHYAQTGRDPELTATARAAAPTIRHHLEMAVGMAPANAGGHRAPAPGSPDAAPSAGAGGEARDSKLGTSPLTTPTNPTATPPGGTGTSNNPGTGSNPPRR